MRRATSPNRCCKAKPCWRKYLEIDHYPWHMPGDRRMAVRLVPERCSVGFLPREYRVGIPSIELEGGAARASRVDVLQALRTE